QAVCPDPYFLRRILPREVRGGNRPQSRHRGARHTGGRAMRPEGAPSPEAGHGGLAMNGPAAGRPAAAGGAAGGPAIVFDEVSLTLGRTAILRGVSFTVSAGSAHALVGPNGAGKSSLVKTLLGQ